MRNSGNNNFLQVILKNFDVLALPLVALVYPLYASIKAIETRSITDDQQWLTYWVLYSMITLFELTFAKVLELLPIWPYAKLILTCWLVLPHFNGAAHVYRRYIRPFYMNPQLPQMPQMPRNSKMWYVPKNNIFSKQDDVLTAAERYMEEHGTESFERLIRSKAEREAKARKHGNYKVFSDDHIMHADREAKARRHGNHMFFSEDHMEAEREAKARMHHGNFNFFSDDHIY